MSDAASDALAHAGDAGDGGDAVAGAAGTFTLIDTAINGGVNGSPVAGYDPMNSDATLSLAVVGAQLSLRANVSTALTIGSVGFVYDATTHTENAAPYMLCGDDGAGNIVNCNLAAGAHTVTATPYSAANLGGTPGTPFTLNFTITP